MGEKRIHEKCLCFSNAELAHLEMRRSLFSGFALLVPFLQLLGLQRHLLPHGLEAFLCYLQLFLLCSHVVDFRLCGKMGGGTQVGTSHYSFTRQQPEPLKQMMYMYTHSKNVPRAPFKTVSCEQHTKKQLCHSASCAYRF